MFLFIAFLVGLLSCLLLCALVPWLDRVILLLRGGGASLLEFLASICEAAKEHLENHDTHWSQVTTREKRQHDLAGQTGSR